MITIIIVAIAFLAIGLGVGVVIYRPRLILARARLSDVSAAMERQQQQFADLQTIFKGLSSEVLKESRDEFIKQAEPKIAEHIRPLEAALKRYDDALRAIEGKRDEAYGGLTGMLKLLQASQAELTRETVGLATALKSPVVRGNWGELTLKRVVEVAGMSEYCDFNVQVTSTSEDTRQRPDMVVRLPGGRTVVVDAKAPRNAFFEAMEAKDEKSRTSHFTLHAEAVRDHMKRLGQKAYWQQFDPAPDFVVMFLPGESFFSAALESDRTLIEDGMISRVILATPTTLIVLLRSVAMGWQQIQLAENSQRISDAGKELFERIGTFAEHFGKIGRNLGQATDSFNNAVGSMERMLIPGARRLKELSATKSPGADVPSVEPIETIPRQISQDIQ